MMEIASPAVFLFLLAGPGFVFRTLNQRHEVRAAETMSLTRATYSSLAAALVINVLAVSLARLSGFSVALGDAASILAGSDSSDVLKAVWCALNTAPWPYLAYFALTWGGAVIAARCWYCLMDIQG